MITLSNVTKTVVILLQINKYNNNNLIIITIETIIAKIKIRINNAW